MNQALIEKYRLHRQEYETQLTQYVQSIAELFDVPVAFLGLSDNETLWIKAKCGTEATEAAYTGAIRTSIPALSGHPFRFNPDTDSGINQPVFC
jgi:hypothetical protein